MSPSSPPSRSGHWPPAGHDGFFSDIDSERHPGSPAPRRCRVPIEVARCQGGISRQQCAHAFLTQGRTQGRHGSTADVIVAGFTLKHRSRGGNFRVVDHGAEELRPVAAENVAGGDEIIISLAVAEWHRVCPGQTIVIEMHNANRRDWNYNTWTYVDDVRLVNHPVWSYRLHLPVIGLNNTMTLPQAPAAPAVDGAQRR